MMLTHKVVRRLVRIFFFRRKRFPFLKIATMILENAFSTVVHMRVLVRGSIFSTRRWHIFFSCAQSIVSAEVRLVARHLQEARALDFRLLSRILCWRRRLQKNK